jgi:tRNA G10  N-methylase Trm11
VQFLAGDIVDIAVQKSAFNFQKSKTIHCDALKWDSTRCASLETMLTFNRLPLRTSSVDVILTDLPFGKRIGFSIQIASLPLFRFSPIKYETLPKDL